MRPVQSDTAPPTGFFGAGSSLLGFAGATLLALGAASCSGSNSPDFTSGGPPINDSGSSFFFSDPNSGGGANDFRLSSMTYGRLVELFAFNQEGIQVSMGRDFVISQNLVGDGVDYIRTTNGVTGQESLLIPKNIDDANERAEFLSLAQAAGSNLTPISVQGLDSTGIYTMLPRNSALVLGFDDLVLPGTVNDRTVQVVSGYPPSAPFVSRVVTSPYYGAVASNGSFYPTRVIVDLTTSDIENFQSSGSVIPPNGVGLPASIEINTPNVQVRIPTRTNASIGQSQTLTNLTDQTLATSGNGPVDFDDLARPVTRAMRSGGLPSLITDPFNGFLRDDTPPVVVGSTPIDIPIAPVQIRVDPSDTGSLLFRIPQVQFSSDLCASAPALDDVIQQGGVFARVVESAAIPLGGLVEDVIVQLMLFPPAWNGPQDWELFGAAAATFESTFEPMGDAVRSECYINLLPTPTGFPEEPATGASTGSVLTLRFSEPMDPSSLTAFDSVTITRESSAGGISLSTSDFVVGSLSQSQSLREVTFSPQQSLAHIQGAAESYFFRLANEDDSFPPRDLAGNIVASLPEIEITLDAGQVSQFNGGRVSRFADTDEEAPAGNEWGGQIQIDTFREVLRSRPVIRTQVVLDNAEQALMQQMTAFPQGVVTPFSPFGSKMQTLWRYADCGFSLTDSQNINIDVEQLSWAPAGGTIVPDSFDEFEIRLSHSRWAPDEIIDPTSLFPQWQNSGLRGNFGLNIFADQIVVHPRERGYVMDQGDLFQTVNGTTLMPFPLNRDVAPEDRNYFTWRDTSLRGRDGNLNGGVEPASYPQALGLPPAPEQYYRRQQVQTIGLPLLMEFRTFLDQSAIGRNGWVLNLAVNSSSKPYFRAFSTGGVNNSGAQVAVDPDAEVTANGGFNPGSTPPGQATFGRDNTVHLGALDYVTRVSRAHSIWFESFIDNETSFGGRRYNEPVIEPAPELQPAGTEILVNYRGAASITFADDPTGANLCNMAGESDNFSGDPAIGTEFMLADYQYNALTLDLYGDYYNDVDATQPPVMGCETSSPVHNPSIGSISLVNFGLEFITGPDPVDDWRTSVNDITGARFYQVRLTFLGNTESGQGAELSAFAMTWGQQ